MIERKKAGKSFSMQTSKLCMERKALIDLSYFNLQSFSKESFLIFHACSFLQRDSKSNKCTT